MRKEIFSQQECLANVPRGRLTSNMARRYWEDLEHGPALKRADRIILTGCGSAYYAGLIGKGLLKGSLGSRRMLYFANQFVFDTTPITSDTVVAAITQSGVTADTVEAQREAKRRGALTLGIVNAVGTTIPSENDGGVYLRVGTESGVASTKAFTAQATALLMLALSAGRLRGRSCSDGMEIVQALANLPHDANRMIAASEQLVHLAAKYGDVPSIYFLGAGPFFPTVMEGALKLKEVAYIHAEAYATGELKHGPLALVTDGFPVLVLAPRGGTSPQTMSALAKLHAIPWVRILILTDEDLSASGPLDAYASDLVRVPQVPSVTAPILWTILLQCFAYEVAVAKGLNPDRPRHLAKTITVR